MERVEGEWEPYGSATSKILGPPRTGFSLTRFFVLVAAHELLQIEFCRVLHLLRVFLSRKSL